jgi:hypothetical protein
MGSHEGERRTLAQWLRHDWSGVLGPRRTQQIIRQNPRVLWWLLAYEIGAFAIYAMVLAVAGRLDIFGGWALIPAFLGASTFGAHLERQRKLSKP